ncbi:MAG TPA: hypothetical protein VE377_13170 [Candidatus Dormibacteraeota bacterium]|nr:hypothetical protein [Candidatus Dormibacteraeota bacterium]
MQPLSRQQLIACLKEKPTSCPLEDPYCDPLWIAAELGRRKHPDLLITAYAKADKTQRQYLAEALWHIDDPRVATFMRSIAFDHLPPGPDSEEVFFPLDYLAQRCDQRALARLNRRVNFDEGYPVGCMLWAPAVESFARCNYRAAAPNLVRSLNSACVNIIDAAEHGLQKFFPGSCKAAGSFDDEARCYDKALQKHSQTPQ